MHIVIAHIGDLLSGFWVTLGLVAFGFTGAVVLGTIVAVCRIVPIRPLRVLGTAYVEFFRNIPLLTLLVLVVFGLPDVGVMFSFFTSSAICLAVTGAAFVCEAVRGGVNSVAVGQAEAARALGLTFWQSLRQVILPQAFRTMVQPLVNIFIGVVLSSSLAAAVGVAELTYKTQELNLQYAEAIPAFIVATILYMVVSFGGAGAGGWLERKVATRR